MDLCKREEVGIDPYSNLFITDRLMSSSSPCISRHVKEEGQLSSQF